MTDEQIDTMLKMHRFLICSEIKQALYQISNDDNAAELQKRTNDEEWNKFALWLRKIRDD
jgi:hypothetical protein